MPRHRTLQYRAAGKPNSAREPAIWASHNSSDAYSPPASDLPCSHQLPPSLPCWSTTSAPRNCDLHGYLLPVWNNLPGAPSLAASSQQTLADHAILNNQGSGPLVAAGTVHLAGGQSGAFIVEIGADQKTTGPSHLPQGLQPGGSGRGYGLAHGP